VATVNCKTNNIQFFAAPGRVITTKLKKNFKNLWKHCFFLQKKRRKVEITCLKSIFLPPNTI